MNCRKRHRPRLVTLSDLTPQELKWLWPDRLPRGKVALVAGDPGLGKSLLSLEIASRVTTGRPWPNEDEIEKYREPSSVLLLTAEDDLEDTVLPRLETAGADTSRIAAIKSVCTIDKSTGETYDRWVNLQTDLDQIREALATLSSPQLVIIDPITAYMGRADTHRNSEVRNILGPLAEVASEYEVAVLAITHLPKSRSSNAKANITGSVAFVAAARAVWAVAPDPDDDNARLFFPVKHNLVANNTALGMRFYIESKDEGVSPFIRWGGEIEVDADTALGSEEEQSALEEAKEWLGGLLAKGPVAQKEIRQLAGNNGHAWRTVFRAKRLLRVTSEKQGFEGGWVWRL